MEVMCPPDKRFNRLNVENDTIRVSWLDILSSFLEQPPVARGDGGSADYQPLDGRHDDHSSTRTIPPSKNH